MDKDKIQYVLRNELAVLQVDYNVDTLELFGSYVRNEQTFDSDIDILVTFSRTSGLFEFINLENHLSDLLGMKVDLVMRSALKRNIGKKIISEAKPI